MSDFSKKVERYRPDLGPYESLYKHFHAHPELSFDEKETAAEIKSHLEKLKTYEIFPNIGGHGLAAVLKNGPGKTVLLRADIDGLPVEEMTGLPYASTVRVMSGGVEKPVMHACGHDMHITSLLAAAETLAAAKKEWSGTLVLIFQPAEERGAGAQAMVDDGLYDKVPVPDIAVGAHVMPFRSGTIGTRCGLMASAADSFHLTLHGRQGHASQPHRTIDPIVLASSTILRLQTIASREVDPSDLAVITCGSFHAGDADNIIPARADLKLDVRTIDATTRTNVLASMRRIIDAECCASNAPKAAELTQTRNFPFLVNDPDVTATLSAAFSEHFIVGSHGYDPNVVRLGGSEDFGILATAVGKPATFYTYGGIDPELWDRLEKEGKLKDDIPVNHSPYFAPVIQPTLRVAVDGYVVAALAMLKE